MSTPAVDVARMKGNLTAQLARAFAPATAPNAPTNPNAPASPNAPAGQEPSAEGAGESTGADSGNAETEVQTSGAEEPNAAAGKPAGQGETPAGDLNKALREARAENKKLKAQLKASQTPEGRAGAPRRPSDETEGDTTAGQPPVKPPTQKTAAQRVTDLQPIVANLRALERQAMRGDVEAVLRRLESVGVKPPVTEAAELVDWLSEQHESYAEQLSSARIKAGIDAAVSEFRENGQRQASEAQASELLPELDNPESEQAQLFTQLKEFHPELANDPMGDSLIAHAVLGLLSKKGKKPAANGNGTAPSNGNKLVLPARGVTPAGRVTPGGLAAPRVEDTTVNGAQLLTRFNGTGKDEDKAAFKQVFGREMLSKIYGLRQPEVMR